ncbi:MAG TPA: (2Fe-2S) ferredoxin domain-containing protein, partial [Spirochaetota bacterium]
MAKLTLDDLRKLREVKKAEFEMRNTEGKEAEIIISMGTCGIAAGAKSSLDAFLDELGNKGVTSVAVKQ